MIETYRSKVDWWIGLALVLGPLAALLGWHFSPPDDHEVGLVGVVVFVVIYGGFLFPLYYELTDRELVVHAGLLRRRVALADITHVEPTRNPLSAPALSLDRLRIQSGGGRALLISPARRAEFLRELALRARLVRDGDRLVRR